MRTAYGVYAMTMFVLVVLLLFCPVLIVAPTLGLRRAIGRITVRAWLLSIGVPFRVTGLAHLPAGPCVALCNHASYVDGILLTAALPTRFTFLVQHGAAEWPYVGLIVRRMGVTFVNRGAPVAAGLVAADLVHQVRAARRGDDSAAVFPEGSFRAAPGLQRFHRGAFAIAAHAGVPVLPAVIRGSRRFFGDGQSLPAWSAIEIEVLPAIAWQGASRAAMGRTTRAAYAAMLARCAEPAADTPVDAAAAGDAGHDSGL